MSKASGGVIDAETAYMVGEQGGCFIPIHRRSDVEVIIRHKDGREYQIDSADFQRGKHAYDEKTGEMVTFVEAGFRVVSLPNGEPYHAPAERHHAAEQGKD